MTAALSCISHNISPSCELREYAVFLPLAFEAFCYWCHLIVLSSSFRRASERPICEIANCANCAKSQVVSRLQTRAGPQSRVSTVSGWEQASDGATRPSELALQVQLSSDRRDPDQSRGPMDLCVFVKTADSSTVCQCQIDAQYPVYPRRTF